MENWKEDIRKRIRERIEQKANSELRFKAADMLVASAEVDPPEKMVKSRMDYFRKVYEVIGKETGEPVDEAKVRELAEKQIKENFAVEKVAENENITVSDDEVAARKASAPAYGNAASEPDEDEIRYRLKREKVIDFIIGSAKIKEKEKPLILKPDEVNLVSER
jgi:trigger factor